MPFTYFGFTVGTAMPFIRDFAPLIDRVERILTASAIFSLRE
jgi:hypothetical protein